MPNTINVQKGTETRVKGLEGEDRQTMENEKTTKKHQ